VNLARWDVDQAEPASGKGGRDSHWIRRTPNGWVDFRVATAGPQCCGRLWRLLPFHRDEPVKLHLAEELAEGGHYYDMPQIHEQLSQSPRPLLDNMESPSTGLSVAAGRITG